jgi:hypothetical protein
MVSIFIGILCDAHYQVKLDDYARFVEAIFLIYLPA